jgi:hypothetical protein
MESDQELFPLWMEYPGEGRLSMCWRMGGGEDYVREWGQWYDSLTPEDRKKYQRKYPEPEEWRGFYSSAKED